LIFSAFAENHYYTEIPERQQAGKAEEDGAIFADTVIRRCPT
jgi:hypothetical protein